MNYVIEPSSLKGIVDAPPSKSLTQRALAVALLRRGRSVITGSGTSNDERAVRVMVETLGAAISALGEELIVDSMGIRPFAPELNCGESGLAARMFLPLAALSDRELRITGEGSLLQRPMDPIISVLPQLQVEVDSVGGRLPIRVKGPLQPANIELDGSLSSQFVSGLILAFSAAGAANCSIRVLRPSSRGYIDLTLDVMRRFQLPVPRNKEYNEFIFDPGDQAPKEETIRYHVEADWSNGALLLVAGAIAGPVLVRGLDPGSLQADRAILDLLMETGAPVAVEAKGIRVRPGKLGAFEFDATDCPDLFPPLVALAAYCEGRSTIAGVSRLLHKESNRAESLRSEFGKMGARVAIEGDLMIIEGGALRGATVHAHNDHRIAMACSVAALGASGRTVIQGGGAVRKSYPDFFHHLKSLGAAVSLPITG